MADHGNVVVVSSTEQFKSKVEEAKGTNKIVVIDFTAVWCGPCRFIAPVFVELSKKFPNLIFLKVDVDEQKAVAEQYQVTAMPTFLFLKDGAEIHKIVGADKAGLEAKVAQLAASA